MGRLAEWLRFCQESTLANTRFCTASLTNPHPFDRRAFCSEDCDIDPMHKVETQSSGDICSCGSYSPEACNDCSAKHSFWITFLQMIHGCLEQRGDLTCEVSLESQFGKLICEEIS